LKEPKSEILLKFLSLSAMGLINVLSGLTSFIFFAAIARLLPASEMGDYSIGLSIFTLFLGLGFNGLDTSLNKLALINDTGLIKRKLKKYFLFNVALLILVSFVLQFFKGWISTGVLYLIYLTILCSPFLFWLKLESVLLGFSENKKIFYLKLIDSVASLVSFGILFYITPSAFHFYFVFLISRAIVSIASIYLVHGAIKNKEQVTNMSGIVYSESEFEGDTIKLSLLGIYTTGLGTVKHTVLYSISPVALAIFYTGTKIPEKIKDYTKYIALIPIQMIFKKGKDEIVTKLFKNKSYIVVSSTMISILVGIFASIATYIIYGKEYKTIESLVVSFIACLSLGPKITACIYQYAEIFLSSTKNFIRETIIFSLVEFLIGILLLYFYGSVGLVISIFLSSVIYLIFLLKRINVNSFSN
jgi:O-antigen/teichoic acid export membrane protein